MIIGADGGYYNTKYKTMDKRGIFTSVVSEDDLDLNTSMQVEYEGKKYSVGTSGSFAADTQKIDDEIFKICLYTAIADAMPGDVDYQVQLVTGLPIAYYQEQKDKLKESLTGELVNISLTKNGVTRKKVFKITSVVVFPQSAGILLTKPELLRKGEYLLVVDIGGFTADVSLFKGKDLVRFRTFQKGMLKLNGLLRSYLSSKGLDMSIFEVRELITSTNAVSGLIPKAIIDGVCSKYVESIINDIKVEFAEYAYSNRVYVGGGSADLDKYIKDTVLEDSIYMNAEAYYKLGVANGKA